MFNYLHIYLQSIRAEYLILQGVLTKHLSCITI